MGRAKAPGGKPAGEGGGADGASDRQTGGIGEGRGGGALSCVSRRRNKAGCWWWTEMGWMVDLDAGRLWLAALGWAGGARRRKRARHVPSGMVPYRTS